MRTSALIRIGNQAHTPGRIDPSAALDGALLNSLQLPREGTPWC